MDPKVRVYAVESRNGHGPNVDLAPAPNKSYLTLQIEKKGVYSPDVKVEDIAYVGWATVTPQPTEDRDGVEFRLVVGKESFTVGPRQLGHHHLTQRCPEQVKAIEKFNRESNYGPESDSD